MRNDSGVSRPWWRLLWEYVRSAPWTFVWITILLATTIIQHSVSQATLDHLLERRSTNLDNLEHRPVAVLVQSLMWIDGYWWFPYFFLYLIFHATAERWLGSLRWLTVGLTAHVAATYISQGSLRFAIHHGWTSSALVDVRDVGVSYFLAAIIGVLAYHVAVPWRWFYIACALVTYGVPLLVHHGFTDIGHFTSLLIGFAFYPITRGRENRLLDPSAVFRYWSTQILQARPPASAGPA